MTFDFRLPLIRGLLIASRVKKWKLNIKREE